MFFSIQYKDDNIKYILILKILKVKTVMWILPILNKITVLNYINNKVRSEHNNPRNLDSST